jgi:hypothetical protein
MEGLTQSNNKAKLNYTAKHKQKLLETSAKAEKNQGGTARIRAPRECTLSVGSRPGVREATYLEQSLSLIGCTCPFFCFCTLFVFGLSFLWANHAGREIGRGRSGGIKPDAALVTMRRTGPFPFFVCFLLSFFFFF